MHALARQAMIAPQNDHSLRSPCCTVKQSLRTPGHSIAIKRQYGQGLTN